MVISGSSCEEFIDLVIQLSEVAFRAARQVHEHLDAVEVWENEGGPCSESV